MRRWDWTAITRIVIMAALGGIGASAGFLHTHSWAEQHGQHGWLAWADAVVIEGMAVVAGFEVRRDHQAGHVSRSGITMPLVVLVASFLVQMTAQVSQAEPTPQGWLLAAMPALGFLIVVKLVMRQRRTRTADTTTQPSPQPGPATPPAAVASAPVSGTTLNRLPVPVRQAVITTAEQAHRAGRPVTTNDITATITLPDPMLTALITELNTTINNHPVAATATET